MLYLYIIVGCVVWFIGMGLTARFQNYMNVGMVSPRGRDNIFSLFFLWPLFNFVFLLGAIFIYGVCNPVSWSWKVLSGENE